MLKYKLEHLIREEVKNLLKDFDSENNIRKTIDEHETKIHPIPIKDRVLGSILHSLNIKFGNFLQKIIKKFLIQEKKYKIFEERLVKKIISNSEEEAIKQYMNEQENAENPPCLEKINNFLKTNYEKIEENKKDSRRINVDLAFQKNNTIYLFEIHYDENHDTVRTPGIYRKLFKTYFSLRRHYKNKLSIQPFILYFLHKNKENTTKKQYHYMLEEKHILRGEQFWKRFTEIDFEEIKEHLQSIAVDVNILRRFKRLKKKIDLWIKN